MDAVFLLEEALDAADDGVVLNPEWVEMSRRKLKEHKALEQALHVETKVTLDICEARNRDDHAVVESLHATLVHASRDWASSSRDAWLWGVIVGWEDGALQDLATQHGWTSCTVARLKRLHGIFTRGN